MEEDCVQWLVTNSAAKKSSVAQDYGLAQIAAFFSKGDAVAKYWEGAEKEESGDCHGALKLYQQA